MNRAKNDFYTGQIMDKLNYFFSYRWFSPSITTLRIQRHNESGIRDTITNTSWCNSEGRVSKKISRTTYHGTKVVRRMVQITVRWCTRKWHWMVRTFLVSFIHFLFSNTAKISQDGLLNLKSEFFWKFQEVLATLYSLVTSVKLRSKRVFNSLQNT